jgi:hypothetical protein
MKRHVVSMLFGGEGDRHTILRLRSPWFAIVTRNPYFTGVSCHLWLSSLAIRRYNPACPLGHVLGQKRRADGAENQSTERARGGDD